MERPRRLLAAAATTLALTGCADKAPQQISPSAARTYQAQPTDMLNCNVDPSDSRPLITPTPERNGLSINLFSCTINSDSSLPTKLVVVFEHSLDNPPKKITSFVADPPSDENDIFGIKSRITDPVTGDCVVIDFQTEGYQFTKAETLPCPPSTITA